MKAGLEAAARAEVAALEEARQREAWLNKPVDRGGRQVVGAAQVQTCTRPAEYMETIEALYDGYAETKPWFNGRELMTRPMVRPRTARQLWDGVRLVGASAGARDGWPVGGGQRTRYGGCAFRTLLQRARSEGCEVSDEQWAEALEKSYPEVVKKKAVEWWDGAPRDHDRYGTVLIHAWPGAEHREGGDRKVFGRRTLEAR